MWMNQYEIELAAQQTHKCPNVSKGVKFLLRLMQAVNEQSDGWPYWQAPGKAAEKLMDLLRTAGTHGTISAIDLRHAITPIRTMVTRQKRIQAKFGNTFVFDVDAALA
jgi:hypothetical protein